MLYNAAFESELLLEGHILFWTLNELGGRLLNFHEDSTFSLLLLYVPINSRFTTGLPQPPTYRVALLACTIACIYEAARTYLLESLPGELKRAKNHIPTKRALVLTVSSGLKPIFFVHSQQILSNHKFHMKVSSLNERSKR